MKTFSKRLAWLLAHEEISRAEFAQKLGISVSSLSHLLSERNLPGMELLMSMCKEFPGLNPSWLLLGQGEAFTQPEPGHLGLFDVKPVNPEPNKPPSEAVQAVVEGSTHSEKEQQAFNSSQYPMEETGNSDSKPSAYEKNHISSDIEYVMVFYVNGTFKKYVPRND